MPDPKCSSAYLSHKTTVYSDEDNNVDEQVTVAASYGTRGSGRRTRRADATTPKDTIVALQNEAGELHMSIS